jgi:hypothetical protein
MKHWEPIEYHYIANNMIKYGGGFFRQIGYAIKKADQVNRNKLSRTFAKEFSKYYEMTDIEDYNSIEDIEDENNESV